jgi:hypothetical protein
VTDISTTNARTVLKITKTTRSSAARNDADADEEVVIAGERVSRL